MHSSEIDTLKIRAPQETFFQTLISTCGDNHFVFVLFLKTIFSCKQPLLSSVGTTAYGRLPGRGSDAERTASGLRGDRSPSTRGAQRMRWWHGLLSCTRRRWWKLLGGDVPSHSRYTLVENGLFFLGWTHKGSKSDDFCQWPHLSNGSSSICTNSIYIEYTGLKSQALTRCYLMRISWGLYSCTIKVSS